MRLPHWSEAYTAFRDPYRPAASEKLAELMSTRASHGRMRRLGEAFFTGTLAVPYAARTTATTWGTYEASTGANWFTSGLRYLIYGEPFAAKKVRQILDTLGVLRADTALCYLYAESVMQEDEVSTNQLYTENGDASSFGDGTSVKSHHSTRMCFPSGFCALFEPLY